jgi:predicted ATP-grasp superfamily ATP-dependent carboligase
MAYTRTGRSNGLCSILGAIKTRIQTKQINNMKTQEQIVSGQDTTSFWRLYWETTLPNSVTVEQWLEVQEYIDSKTLEFITEKNK